MPITQTPGLVKDVPINPSQTNIANRIETRPIIDHRSASPLALLLGDHSVSDPPDPISNSAVKPDRANGTNAQALEE